MQSNIIITKSLSRHFHTLRAVDNISIEVPSGKVFGYLGPNGSGKTTTIRLLLGLFEPTSGSASVLGYDTVTQANEIRQRCGALLEHTGLYERMTALDNLEFYGKIWHIPAVQLSARIKELMTSFDLWDRRGEVVGNWSRGMKQKLAIARVLIHRPKLVFLDEPTAGLDPVAAANLRTDLENLVEQHGVTVFLTTHNLAEAEKMCDSLAVIREGKLLACGSPDMLRLSQPNHNIKITGRGFSEAALSAIRQRPEVIDVIQEDSHILVQLRDSTDTAPLVSLLVTNGVQIDEIQKGKASLEEAFLALMEEEK